MSKPTREAFLSVWMDLEKSTGEIANVLADAIYGTPEAPAGAPCSLAPAGWWCSRDAGHAGPCAAREKADPVEVPISADAASRACAKAIEALDTMTAERDRLKADLAAANERAEKAELALKNSTRGYWALHAECEELEKHRDGTLRARAEAAESALAEKTTECEGLERTVKLANGAIDAAVMAEGLRCERACELQFSNHPFKICRQAWDGAINACLDAIRARRQVKEGT